MRSASDVTNGAETFEALQWAAYGALWLMQRAMLPKSDNLHNAEVKLYRIRANSRQLRAAAIILERRYSSGTEQDKQGRKARGEPETAEPGAAGYEERLDLVRKGNAPPIMPRLFGGTLERTAEALFKLAARPTQRDRPARRLGRIRAQHRSGAPGRVAVNDVCAVLLGCWSSRRRRRYVIARPQRCTFPPTLVDTETVGAAEAGATQGCVAARVEGSRHRRDRVVRARDGPVQILGGGEPRLHRLDGP